jgi:hypothetical protein
MYAEVFAREPAATRALAQVRVRVRVRVRCSVELRLEC